MVTDYFDDIELGICLRVNALSRNRSVRAFFSAVSRLGDYPAWVVFGLATLYLVDGSKVAFFAQAGVTAILGVSVYKLLKRRLVRERPFVTHGEIVCGTTPLDRYSFPSGHTLHAAGFTVLYCTHVPEMLIVMLPFAGLIAASRVILGLHYPSDVVVGGALGAGIASTVLAVAA
ncbi:MAG: phosphatase PAP2 family protein [Pseudomonadota bacterium]